MKHELSSDVKNQIRLYWGIKTTKWIAKRFGVSSKTITALVKVSDAEALDYLAWYYGGRGQALDNALRASEASSRGRGKPVKK
jgi:transposase